MSDYLAFRDRFAEAMDGSLYPIDYLDWLVRTGQALFWSTEHSAIVATIKVYPTGAKDVHGLIAAGDKDEIADILIPQAEAWGRANDCVGAVIESRGGWSRVMRGHGYEPFQVSIRKVL